MIKVKLTFPYPDWPIERQLPGQKLQQEDCRFYINDSVEECDYWFVYGGLVGKESARCPKENTVLITTEPDDLYEYQPEFVKQFGSVITCQKRIKKYHPNVILSQQALPWHVGRRININNGQSIFTKDYDELKAIKTHNKDRLVSLVASSKTMTQGHRDRLKFMEQVRDSFGGQIDIFGRGIRDIDDKWNAISPYKYHIVIENDYLDDWWTEKLADSYLAGAYPIFYGCPNLEKYFSADSFVRIDIKKPAEAIKIIKNTLIGDLWTNKASELAKAKNKILDEYNLFNLMKKFALEKNNFKLSNQSISLIPESMNFNPGSINLFKKILSKFNRENIL